MKQLRTRCCRTPWEGHTTGSGSWMCVEVTEGISEGSLEEEILS